MRNEQNADTAERFSWQFNYPVERVSAAAQERAGHHRSRQDWWKNELEEAEKNLKEKGFEYRQRGYTGGEEVVIVGDPELAKRAATCRDKVERHLATAKTYETWVRALSSAPPEAMLKLTIADVSYFAL